jgi:hypothetical protein
MSNTLPVRLTTRKTTDGEIYEGIVTISQSLMPVKLRRRADGSTQFPTRSAVLGTARNVAKQFGFTDVEVEDGTEQKKTAAKAAVKTVAKTTAKTATTETATTNKAAKKSSSTPTKTATASNSSTTSGSVPSTTASSTSASRTTNARS